MGLWDWLTGSTSAAASPQPAPLAALQSPPVRSKSFSPLPTTGPALQNYPTSADAVQARQGGFGYGDPASAYIEGTAGRIYGDKTGALPMEGRAPIPADGLSLGALIGRGWQTPTTQNATPPQRAMTQDAMTRAALALNYSPLAALGFNPREITADVSGQSKFKRQLSGATDPETGRIFYQAGDPETIVHESMHRGLLKLVNDPRLPAYLRERIDPSNPDHESTVRQFMRAQAGNPETDRTALAQQAQGEQWTPQEIALVNRLAQQTIAKNRPRGPR
jgi:hypothetical protein